MENREIGLEFLRCFCAGDVAGLAPLIAEDLKFSGPLFQFDSRDAYLNSLQDGSLEKCGYRILSVTENKDQVSIYYTYEKADQAITIAQLFRFRDQKIIEMLLVFDSRGIGP